jgi:hypothetical protein
VGFGADCGWRRIEAPNQTSNYTHVGNQSLALGGKIAFIHRLIFKAHSGHSWRMGAAQDLLCAGFDRAAIMRAGGWKSVNVLGRYLEFAEDNVWGKN